MGFEFWIWVAIGVITLIARTRNKQKTTPPKPRKGPDPVVMDEVQTFEDLLEEIENTKKSPDLEQPPHYGDYNPDPREQYDNARREKEVGLPKSYTETVEASKKEYTDQHFPMVDTSSVLETPDTQLGDTGGVKKKFIDQEEDLGSKAKSPLLLDLLNNPDELKKAFILTEIINRKY